MDGATFKFYLASQSFFNLVVLKRSGSAEPKTGPLRTILLVEGWSLLPLLQLNKRHYMRKTFLLLLLATCIGSGLQAQEKKPKIVFDKTVHDFGEIKEDGGKVTHRFDFTNQGGDPLIVNRVDASCGCTSPSWTGKPVMSGSQGYIGATFDPRRRPGPFNKTVIVRSNASNGVVILKIKGEVLRKERTLAEKYPRQMGELRLKSHHLAFVEVKHNHKDRDSLGVVNVSGEPVTVGFDRMPDHIRLSTRPGVLQPGEEGFIVGEYDPSRIDDWGFRMDRVRVRVNGEEVSHNNLVLSARIVEDFSELSERERQNAPHVEFAKTTHNFGRVNAGSRVHQVFHFRNTGKSDLIVRKIRATCGCTTIMPDKKMIKAGESGSFKAILSVGTRKGSLHKSIYFISNDPDNPNIRLSLKARVE